MLEANINSDKEQPYLFNPDSGQIDMNYNEHKTLITLCQNTRMI
jgi:hypothetical protein